MSGYVLFDCGGLDVDDSAEQTIDGIYDEAKEALATGKMVIATNFVTSGMPYSPGALIMVDRGRDGISAILNFMRIDIAEDDGVIVTNLITG